MECSSGLNLAITIQDIVAIHQYMYICMHVLDGKEFMDGKETSGKGINVATYHMHAAGSLA